MNLQEELDEARERIVQLEEIIGARTEFPPALKLTPREAQILGMLLKREVLTYAAMEQTIFWNAEIDDPSNNVKVYIYRLRRKLERHDIAVRNKYGAGYFLDPNDKAKLRAIVEAGA